MAEQNVLTDESQALKAQLEAQMKERSERETYLYNQIAEWTKRVQANDEADAAREAQGQQQDHHLLARLQALENQQGVQHLGPSGLSDGDDTEDDEDDTAVTLLDDRVVYLPTAWLRYLGDEGRVAQLRAKVESYMRPRVSGRDMYEVQAGLDGICRLLLTPGIMAAFQSGAGEGLVAHLQTVADRWFFLETSHEEGLTTALRQKKLLPGGMSSLPARYRRVRAAAHLGEVKVKDASKVKQATGQQAGRKKK